MYYKLKIIFIIFCLIPPLSRASKISSSSSSNLSSQNLNYTEKKLIDAPEINSKEFFETDLKQKKHPLNISWSPTSNADFYEVEITRTKDCSRRYFKVLKNNFNIVVYPNARYLWRVLAYSKSDLLTDYSIKNKLYLKAPTGEHIVSKYELPYSNEVINLRDIASDTDTALCSYPSVKEQFNSQDTADDTLAASDQKTIERKPAYSYANKYSLWGRSWIKGGLGLNAYFYKQKNLDDNEISHNAVNWPNYSIEAGTFFNSNFALSLIANFNTSEFEDISQIINEKYNKQKFVLEGIYTLGSDWKTTKNSQWHLKFGASYSNTPIIYISQIKNSLNLLEAKVIQIRAGIGYKNKITNKFRPELGLSIALPVILTTENDDIELDSGISLEFNAGINYQLYNNYQVGLFWQTEVTSHEYTQKGSSSNISGSLLNIDNNLGVFLGLEF